MKETYIAMLRGINVSGQKKIKMSDLSGYFEALGYDNVTTYIQSGNIIFQAKKTNVETLARQIENKIQKEYGFDVPALVKQPPYFEYVLKNNPFLKRKENMERLYVTFLSGKPAKQKVDLIDAAQYKPEEFILDNDIVFLFSPLGYGNAKMNNNFFEAKLKVKATTRNWKTVQKLFEMSA